MNARVIYMQAGFWKELRADTSITGLQHLIKVYETISEANLRTDIEIEDWDSDPYLMPLWKKYLSNQLDVELYEKITLDKPEENAEDLSAIYLTKLDVQTCRNLGTNYGIVVINNQDLYEKKYLLKGVSFRLKKDEILYEDRYMRFRPKIHYPCNSMILIDPYILSRRENIDNSLSSLLDAMLPTRKLKPMFYISIISMIGEKNRDYEKGGKVFDQIQNLIIALRKGLNFDLTLYAIGASEEFHRRMIITNNVLLIAEDGFDVFRESGSSSKNARFTTVFPRIVGDSRLDMSEYLEWIEIVKNRSESQSETQYWGTRKNRLFELVK